MYHRNHNADDVGWRYHSNTIRARPPPSLTTRARERWLGLMSTHLGSCTAGSVESRTGGHKRIDGSWRPAWILKVHTDRQPASASSRVPPSQRTWQTAGRLHEARPAAVCNDPAELTANVPCGRAHTYICTVCNLQMCTCMYAAGRRRRRRRHNADRA